MTNYCVLSVALYISCPPLDELQPLIMLILPHEPINGSSELCFRVTRVGNFSGELINTCPNAFAVTLIPVYSENRNLRVR
jgi:hypothetical protein